MSLLTGPSQEGLWFLHLRSEKGNLELNDIFANRIAGVEIKNKADPILYQNSIHHRQTGGVYIHEKVCPVFVNMYVRAFLLIFLAVLFSTNKMNTLVYVCVCTHVYCVYCIYCLYCVYSVYCMYCVCGV